MTHTKEMPESLSMKFVERSCFIHERQPYEVVVKCSNEPLCTIAGRKIFACVELLKGTSVVWHEYFDQIITKEHSQEAIGNIQKHINQIVNPKNGTQVNNKAELDNTNGSAQKNN